MEINKSATGLEVLKKNKFLLKFGNGNEAMVRLVISIEIAASSCTHNTGLPVKLKFQITGISREQYEFLINNTEMKTLIRFQI